MPPRPDDDSTALTESYLGEFLDPLAPAPLATSALAPTTPIRGSTTLSVDPSPSPRKLSVEIDMGFVNDSIDKFLNALQEPKYQNPLTGDEIADLFQAFYKQTEDDLAEQGNRKKVNSRILDTIERSLTQTLYPKLFEPNSENHRAQLFDKRLAALRGSQQLLEKLELDISPEIRPQLEPVIGYLSNIERAKAPQEKLYCIVQVNKMIVDVFKDSSCAGDVILPVLVYCILACPVTSIWRHAIYTRRFRRESALKGQHSYCLTNVEAAIYFLETFTVAPEDLPPEVDSSLFVSRSRANSDARSRSNSDALRSRSNSTASESQRTTPMRSRIGVIGASVSASVSKYLAQKLATQQAPQTIAEVQQKLESDNTSVSTGDTESCAPPLVNQRFMNADLDTLTMTEMKQLLSEYKRLGTYVQSI